MTIYSIYKATNIITGKSYIGFSGNYASRKRVHKCNALDNKVINYFYNSIRKHGWDNFKWEIIYQSKDKLYTLNTMESYFINEYNTINPFGYNTKSGGDGANLSEESKRKISESRIGMIFTKEHIENLRLSHLGFRPTEETRQKLSIARRKRKGFKTKPLSDETKRKLSLSLSGRKYPNMKKLRCSCVICRKNISNNHLGLHYRIHK